MKERVKHPGDLCFVCGENNPYGLKVKAYREKGKIRAYFKSTEVHKGFGRLTHGGAIAGVMDEVLSFIPFLRGDGVYLTVELKIKFIRGLPRGKEVIIEAEEKKRRKNCMIVEGEMKGKRGELYAVARAKYKRISDELAKIYSS